MTKTSLFNPLEYLQSDAEIASYLTEAYEDENPAVFIVALGHVVRSKGVSNTRELPDTFMANNHALLGAIHLQAPPRQRGCKQPPINARRDP